MSQNARSSITKFDMTVTTTSGDGGTTKTENSIKLEGDLGPKALTQIVGSLMEQIRTRTSVREEKQQEVKDSHPDIEIIEIIDPLGAAPVEAAPVDLAPVEAAPVVSPVNRNAPLPHLGDFIHQPGRVFDPFTMTQLRRAWDEYGYITLASFNSPVTRYKIAFPHLRGNVEQSQVSENPQITEDHDFPVCACPSFYYNNRRWVDSHGRNRTGCCKHLSMILEALGVDQAVFYWEQKDDAVHENVRRLVNNFDDTN